MEKILLARAVEIARHAHGDQKDKAGAPYIQHLLAVSNALEPFGEHLQVAGVLHDVLEDTPLVAEDLLNLAIPMTVVSIVETVSRDSSLPYQQWILEVVCKDYDASLVKLADNAHNADSSRLNAATEEQRKKAASLSKRYRIARAALIQKVGKDTAHKIFERVNPALLAELD